MSFHSALLWGPWFLVCWAKQFSKHLWFPEFPLLYLFPTSVPHHSFITNTSRALLHKDFSVMSHVFLYLEKKYFECKNLQSRR